MTDDRIWAVCSAHQWHGYKVYRAYEERDNAIEYIREHVTDFDEWNEWEDGGGIIWQSDESNADGHPIHGYRLRSVAVEDRDDGGGEP